MAAYEHHKAGEPKSDDNMDFSLALIRRYRSTTRPAPCGVELRRTGRSTIFPWNLRRRWTDCFDGEVAGGSATRMCPAAGARIDCRTRFNDRLELYGEIYDLQDANQIGSVPKQRELTLDLGGRQMLDRAGHFRLLFMGGRAIQA